MARASKASSAAKKAPTKKSTKKVTAKKAATTEKAAPKKAAAKKAAATKAPKKTAAKKAAAKKAAKTATAKNDAAKTATKPAPRARKAKSPFDSRFLERMRKLLVVERDTYERQAGQLRAEAQSLVDSMEPGDVNFDEEGGEGDTIAVERNRDLALAEKAMEMIDEIDHAMAKFDLGTYGICEVSGEPIPTERLEAIPWAREKVEYKVGGFGRR